MPKYHVLIEFPLDITAYYRKQRGTHFGKGSADSLANAIETDEPLEKGHAYTVAVGVMRLACRVDHVYEDEEDPDAPMRAELSVDERLLPHEPVRILSIVDTLKQAGWV